MDYQNDLDKDARDLLALVPEDGSALGNTRLQRQLGWEKERYFAVRDPLVDAGMLARAGGRGGSVLRVAGARMADESRITPTGAGVVHEVDQQNDLLDQDGRNLLRLVPDNGSRIGNTRLRRRLGWEEDHYLTVRDRLVGAGLLARSGGTGGTVYGVAAARTADESRTALRGARVGDRADRRDISDQDSEKLLALVPEDGSASGNTRLLRKLGWKEDRYFAVRDGLVDAGQLALGRGRGGSVYRVAAAKTARQPKKPFTKEKDLYKPIAEALAEYWSKALRDANYVVEITASQGRRATGGLWTRPDITVVSVSNYRFVPGKVMDIMTYEIKPEGGWQVDGVFEAASHSRFATHSYLVVHTPKGAGSIESEGLERVEKECARFEIGLVLVPDPASYDSFDFRIDPVRRQPDPEEMNRFIDQQISSEKKNRIVSWW